MPAFAIERVRYADFRRRLISFHFPISIIDIYFDFYFLIIILPPFFFIFFCCLITFSAPFSVYFFFRLMFMPSPLPDISLAAFSIAFSLSSMPLLSCRDAIFLTIPPFSMPLLFMLRHDASSLSFRLHGCRLMMPPTPSFMPLSSSPADFAAAFLSCFFEDYFLHAAPCLPPAR